MSKFHFYAVRASAIILILFSLGFSIYSFANAWVEPNTTPPGGNVAAPLHTGTTSQTKQGSLSVSGAGGYGVYAQGASYGVYGVNTSTGAYGLLGYGGWGGLFGGPVYVGGSVGIGTATINNRLQISSGGSGSGIQFNIGSYPSSWGTRLFNQDCYNGACNGVDFAIETQQGGSWYTDATFSHGQDVNHPSLRTWYSTYLATNGGSVGIGTASPGYKLDISGTARINSWDSQLYQGNGYSRRSIGGAHGWDSNMLYLNGWGDWTSGVSVGGPGGASRLCINGDCRSGWPSSDIYLPLAGGVMNAGSRVGFNGGTSYGIGQGAASPNLNSIAVDTLETDGGVGGGGTLELNYYGGNAVTIGPGGTKPLYAAIMYDGNNSGYRVDPNGSSRMNQLYYVDSAYIVDLRPQYMYDWNDGNYYMDFNNVSSLNDLRVNILYDRQNTGYYVDPNGNTRLNNSYTGGFLTSWPGYSGFVGYYGNYIFPGWNDSASWNQSYFIYGNSGNSGLRTNGNWLVDGNIYCASCGGWLSTLFNGILRLDTWQGNHYSGSDGAEYATIFYDANNSGYRVDPNGSSRMNQLYYVDSAYIVDLRPQYMYDWNNTSYYMDFNNTSRLNALYTNTDYAYSWMQAPIYYDQQNTGYYVDPNGSSRMNQLYYVDSAYIVDLRPQYMYDWNDGNYYMDFNNTSRVNYLGRNYGWNWTEYDWNDTTYYMDLNNVSILNDLRVNILYDRQNTGYYVDPNGYSNVYAMQPVYSFNGPVYDYNNGSYYVDPYSTTVLNVVYANQYNCMSDINLKKDIKPIDNALDKVLSIKGVSFTWKDEEMGTGNQVGVIAQDVEKVLPEVVTTNEQGLKAVDYSKLTPLIIESIKDLKIEKDQDVGSLREKIDNLETNERAREEIINDLKRRIEALESK